MFRVAQEGVILAIHLQPQAKRDEIAGTHAGALKIRLKAPPVDGKANQALLAFLAQRLSLPKGKIKILKGLTSRQKQVLIQGLSLEEVKKRLKV